MISIIVCMSQNKVIGINNKLPWKLPEDMAYFKKTTVGKSVLMGRKTYDSIGKALKDRENYILTKNKDYISNDSIVIHDIKEISGKEDLFIIGGSEIYKQTLAIADRLYITKINHNFEGDTYFPDFNLGEWEEVSNEKGIKDEKNPYDYDFIIYQRKSI
jgi:dihydrofolate reductase